MTNLTLPPTKIGYRIVLVIEDLQLKWSVLTARSLFSGDRDDKDDQFIDDFSYQILINQAIIIKKAGPFESALLFENEY
jgi:hypothetical protein